MIESTLRFFFGDNVEVGEDAIATSLEAFNKHSQASFFSPAPCRGIARSASRYILVATAR